MLLRRVEPEYPTMAKKMRIAGDVVLSARVTKDGWVANVKKVSGSSLLAEEAMRVVRQWRYEPYKLNGELQDVDITITMHFRLPN
jgi:protein TonB